MSAKNKAPDIRFKEFSESWIKKILANVLDERKILQRITNDAPILAFAAGQGVIDRSERKSNNRDHLTLDQENKKYKLTEYNDIVYNPSNLKYGAIDRNKYGRGVISPIYVTFTTVEISSFIELIVKSEKFKLRALVFEEGTVVKRQSVKPENLLSLKVSLSPSLDEQTKIGNYFQQLDTLITQHQQKHDKLLNIKKALLEKMFPKQETTEPEIRFKGFSGEWEEGALGDVTDVYDGTHQTPKYTSTGVMFLSVENIKNLKSKKFISKESFEKEFKIFPKKNDVLMSRIGDVGTANVVESDSPKAYYVTLALLKYKELDPYFLKGSIAAEKVRKDIWHRTLHIAFPKKINMNEITKVMVPYPVSKEEQTKIGNLFQQLDTLINQHQTQIKKLVSIKQACLEKMFV